MQKSEIAQAFLEAYSQHQVEKMLSLFSSEATFEYVPYGEQGKGKIHEAAAGMWQGFIEAFPDFKIEIKSLMETTEGKVVAETVNGGTQAQDIFGIESKGLSQYTPHVFIFSFDEAGKIQHLKAYWDNNTIYAQLKHTEVHE